MSLGYKTFFNILNSYFVDFIFKLDKELHILGKHIQFQVR